MTFTRKVVKVFGTYVGSGEGAPGDRNSENTYFSHWFVQGGEQLPYE